MRVQQHTDDQRQVIQHNIEAWNRHRKKREEAIIRRENARKFDAIGDRMPAWRGQ